MYLEGKGIKIGKTISKDAMNIKNKSSKVEENKKGEKSLRNLVDQDKANKPEEFEKAMQKVWNPDT